MFNIFAFFLSILCIPAHAQITWEIKDCTLIKTEKSRDTWGGYCDGTNISQSQKGILVVHHSEWPIGNIRYEKDRGKWFCIDGTHCHKKSVSFGEPINFNRCNYPYAQGFDASAMPPVNVLNIITRKHEACARTIEIESDRASQSANQACKRHYVGKSVQVQMNWGKLDAEIRGIGNGRMNIRWYNPITHDYGTSEVACGDY